MMDCGLIGLRQWVGGRGGCGDFYSREHVKDTSIPARTQLYSPI